MFLVHKEPWMLDNEGNKYLVHHSNNNISTTEWIDSLQSNFDNNSTQTVEAVKILLQSHYQFSCIMLLLSSLLVLFISLFAARNQTLLLSTHVFLAIWLWVFGAYMRSFASHSIHQRMYYFAMISNLFGTIACLIHIMTKKPTQGEQEQQQQQDKKKQ
jgi:hypothetical protein